MRRILQIMCIGVATLLLGCASISHAATEQNDGLRIEYAMTAHNSIPVVFENGLGGTFNAWKRVLPEISKDTTTFVYNRPGYGDSDAVTTPRDGTHVADELRSLLHGKGLKPPYVLVGHSLGGLYMQYFARRYPDEVAALILVDSLPPDAKLGNDARENWPVWERLKFVLITSTVMKNELNAVDSTGDAVLGLPTVSGKPVVILSALHTEGEPDDAHEKRKDLLRLYPGARQIWVESGHKIQLERPEAVVAAIREVLPLFSRKDSTNLK